MSEQSRAFPARPNLRYLKIEAKRRLSSTSLLIRRSGGQASVAMTTRRVPIEPVNVRLLTPVA